MRKTKDIFIVDKMDVVHRDKLIQNLIRKMVDLVDAQYDEDCLSEEDKKHYDKVINDAKEAIGWD